ncbi:MAG TPA: hypothetical protein VGH15_12960 [Caulobacteraceae bacterium]|jgi:hypothetical protein
MYASGASDLERPIDGRLGWFEGVRDDRICGWTYDPARPGRPLEVTLATASGARRSILADRFRADLQAAGACDGWHGFSIPLAVLPDAEGGVECLWSDSGRALSGSPWSAPRGSGRAFRAGSVMLSLDPPNPGDPRLTGYVHDRHEPLRRLRLRARRGDDFVSSTTASLHRGRRRGEAGDGFHGFILALPAPLRMLEGGVEIVDADSGRRLAWLGARSL